MKEIVGASLSRFHDSEDQFEFLISYADGREVGHEVSRRAALTIQAELNRNLDLNNPPPSSHVAVLDANTQSLLAAQNNVIDGLMAENDKLRIGLAKINDIRNSIIGCQKMNWSEHIYPLVAALNEAGIEGQNYPEAREYVGTMLERTLAAENAVDGLRSALKLAIDHIEHMAAHLSNRGTGYSFESLGEDMQGLKAALATTEGKDND